MGFNSGFKGLRKSASLYNTLNIVNLFARWPHDSPSHFGPVFFSLAYHAHKIRYKTDRLSAFPSPASLTESSVTD